MPCILHVKAKPNARTIQMLRSPAAGRVVRLPVSAQHRQANACLLKVLAQMFGVDKSSHTLLSGHTAPFKKVAVNGIDEVKNLAVVAGLSTA